MIRPSPMCRDHDRPASPALLAKAGAAILAATMAIRFRSFRTIAESLDEGGDGRPETAYWIRRAVAAWGRRLPWRAKCFEQGLAAAWMLRRRGRAYDLHYGAAQKEVA
ncbi:lasso peptide biosynthesis B2 protein [Sphingomonas sp. HDW15A]|nr:lasso peptide biosynthesis B2 protein [Sphingomonas sp. HDW15A]